jgi:translation initiation factor IF-2
VNQLQSHGLNSALYDENPDSKRYVSLVPVSAHTGQGVSDLMKLLIKLTQTLLRRQLELSDKIKGVVMDVKIVEGLGITLDTILSNGTLRVKDEIVIDGKIVSIKSMFINDEKLDIVHGSAGVKLVISNSENAKVGSTITSIDEIGNIEVNQIKFDLTPRGVAIYASTFGSLEALYLLTVSKKIPVRSVNIGTVTKREVLNNLIGEYTDKVIFAFDVDVSNDAQKQASIEEVEIITGDVIYQILSMYETYIGKKSEELRKLEMKRIETEIVWPCELEILNVFNNKAPIILGVRVVNGKLKTQTPLVTESGIEIGKIVTIEKNRETISEAIEGDEVAIRIDSNIQFKQKEVKTLYSQLNRKRIDLLKTYFTDTLTLNEKKLIVTLKRMQKI